MNAPVKTARSAPAKATLHKPRPELGQAKSITHALRTLLVLADARKPQGVTAIANALGLHKSSASRILATLRAEKFVDREPESGRYQLGLGILSLAGVVLSKYRLPSTARQQLEVLAEQTGETVTVSGWNGQEAVNVDQILDSRSLSHFSPPGRVNPAHCTATGKVFLAWSDDEAIKQALGRTLDRYTARTVVSARTLRKELKDVRLRGHAVANGEFLEDVASIAAPVFGQNGTVSYAIAVTLPAFRFSPARQEELSRQLLDIARELSVRTGFNPFFGASSANWQ
jgi:DNA-binding IclR family transcriptional regulator